MSEEEQAWDDLTARINDLRLKYKVEETGTTSTEEKAANIASTLISVELRPMVMSTCEKPPVKKKIPAALPLSALKMVRARLPLHPLPAPEMRPSRLWLAGRACTRRV